jgi:hypothetical protein
MSKIKEAFLNNLPEDEIDDSLDLSDEPTEKAKNYSKYLSIITTIREFSSISQGSVTSISRKPIRVFRQWNKETIFITPRVGDILNIKEYLFLPEPEFTGNSLLIKVLDVRVSEDSTFTIQFKIMSESNETLLNNLSEAEAEEIFNAVFRESKPPRIPKVPKISESKKVYVQFRVQLKLRSYRDVENLLGFISQKVELVETGKSIQLGDYYEVGYTFSEVNLLKFLDLLDEYIGKVDGFVCKSEIV